MSSVTGAQREKGKTLNAKEENKKQEYYNIS